MNKKTLIHKTFKAFEVFHYSLVIYWIIALIHLLVIGVEFIIHYINENNIFTANMLKDASFVLIDISVIAGLCFYLIIKRFKFSGEYNKEKIINILILVVFVLLQILQKTSLEYFTLKLFGSLPLNDFLRSAFTVLFSSEVFEISFFVILMSKIMKLNQTNSETGR